MTRPAQAACPASGTRGFRPLIAPDLALDRLHLIVPDGSDAMVVLATLADGPGQDPRAVFAERLAELGHLSASFANGDGTQVRLFLPDLVLQCSVQPDRDGDREHLALRVDAIRPTSGQPEASKLLTVTARSSIVSAGNGIASDTHRILDWYQATVRAAQSPSLYATLKLVERLETAEKTRAQTQRTRYDSAREFWRCRSCRALWRPAEHDRCPSCGRVFAEVDWRQPEVGKVELHVPPGETINLQPDAAVVVEPEDEPNFVGRVARIDHQRRIVEVVCRTFGHAGTEGTITPSFNRALYQAKRSVLAAIATRDLGVGLLAQLLVSPETIYAPRVEDVDSPWLTPGMVANPPQNRAVAMLAALDAGEAVFIQGPPGTGKTTVIVEAIKRRLARNPEERILVTSHSNLAVDNALERLAGTPGMRAVRVARAERVHPAVEAFRCDDEDDPRLMTANCYFATCATAATSSITDMNFDVVILDEANKARADEALPALRLGRALALVGDHKQLPPVEDDALYAIVEQDPSLEELVNRSLFEQCWEGGLPDSAKCLLTIQHRMHPQISAYISKASYEGQLQDAPEVQAYGFVTRKPFPVALHFVDTAGMKGGRERRGPGGALRNEAEVRVAAHVVRLLDERCPRDLSMAVIAMYAEQVERLRQALGRRRFKRPVKIDTVDAFEGREEDIVVISLVRSNERGRIGFLRVPNRLNVAVSRARRLVVCIGDSATLRAGEESMYGELVEAAKEAGGYLSASELLAPKKKGERAAAGDAETEVATKKRRRRRRRRSGAVAAESAAAAVVPGTTEVQATPETAGGDGVAGTQPSRRRRRRRRRGKGTSVLVGSTSVVGAVEGAEDGTGIAAMAEAGGATGDGQGLGGTRRRRRRRRRRSSATPAAPVSSANGDGIAEPGRSPEIAVSVAPTGEGPAPAA